MVPKPTATAQPHCLEAARAAALASHSAASMYAAAGRREAARLLLASEALARAATTILLSSRRLLQLELLAMAPWTLTPAMRRRLLEHGGAVARRTRMAPSRTP